MKVIRYETEYYTVKQDPGIPDGPRTLTRSRQVLIQEEEVEIPEGCVAKGDYFYDPKESKPALRRFVRYYPKAAVELQFCGYFS